MSGHYLIDPEAITWVDDEGEIVRTWETPAHFFDELVWSGCPLFHDRSGEVFFDVELEARGRPARVHINDESMPTTPLSDGALEIVLRWQGQHDL
jgi:hypothetical protein